eukprot:scaffold152_cov383-Prasinococcus_capsulatus_cf.AAC.2
MQKRPICRNQRDSHLGYGPAEALVVRYSRNEGALASQVDRQLRGARSCGQCTRSSGRHTPRALRSAGSIGARQHLRALPLSNKGTPHNRSATLGSIQLLTSVSPHLDLRRSWNAAS